MNLVHLYDIDRDNFKVACRAFVADLGTLLSCCLCLFLFSILSETRYFNNICRKASTTLKLWPSAYDTLVHDHISIIRLFKFELCLVICFALPYNDTLNNQPVLQSC